MAHSQPLFDNFYLPMEEILVSVVTPVYNAEDYLDRCLASVTGQVFANWEHIVIDGMSSDNTLRILGNHRDSRLRWISERDSGIYEAMQKGIARAKGRWLYFLGADDVLVTCLHKVAPLLKHQRTVYYGDVYLPGKNKVLGGRFSATRLSCQNICHQAIFYPRTVFDQFRFDSRYKLLADYVLNLELWGYKEFTFKYLPILVAIFDDRGRSSTTTDHAFEADRQLLIEKHLGRDIKRERLTAAVWSRAGALKHWLFGG